MLAECGTGLKEKMVQAARHGQSWCKLARERPSRLANRGRVRLREAVRMLEGDAWVSREEEAAGLSRIRQHCRDRQPSNGLLWPRCSAYSRRELRWACEMTRAEPLLESRQRGHGRRVRGPAMPPSTPYASVHWITGTGAANQGCPNRPATMLPTNMATQPRLSHRHQPLRRLSKLILQMPLLG
ncbi:hypothetical protein EJ04DRAFT_523855 [Polyplosphaeria fusca]|uniref:Uncharacterized protein n=1 Tax=Polyplosphaeria fusca TaxID=682080 RepID=A0A9P4R097_9PLEO|nr:hypothetical protein EJ04DRAFT_523855 [Polyplosphaeria fusca]